VQLKAFEEAWAIRRKFMRQPETIQSDILIADGKIAQATAEVAKLDARIADIQRGAPELQRSRSTSWAALAGVDRRELEKQVSDADAKKAPLNREIAAINAQLANLQKSIVDAARIVGATVTRLYLSPKMFTKFDVVIIDEASMVLLPAPFHAAGLAKEKVIVSGDFRQLPPIVPTDEEAILAELATDVFGRAGITKAVNSGVRPKRGVILETQSHINDLRANVSGASANNGIPTSKTIPPAPFEATLTVVDTSTIVPFVNRDPVGSRYNLMHGLAVRNLVHHFQHDGYLTSLKRLGVCSPFAAQAKLLKRLLADLRPGVPVEAGTVHRDQGNEKEMMVTDIPDGVGEPRPGRWLDAELADEDGAKLFNVAISRSRHHLVFFCQHRLPGPEAAGSIPPERDAVLCPGPSADMSEAKEIERFRFAEPELGTLRRCKAAERDQSGLLRMQCQRKLRQPLAHHVEKASAVGLVLEADHDVVRITHDHHVASSLAPSPAQRSKT
jgi:hypothetical protein